jgi:hypothetical protein
MQMMTKETGSSFALERIIRKESESIHMIAE